MVSEAEFRKLKEKLMKTNYYYFSTERGVLLVGDSVEILQLLPENCIDLIHTDPPYGFGEYRISFHRIPQEKQERESIVRLMKVFNLYVWSDKNLLPFYLNFALNHNLLYDILVYAKIDPLPTFASSYLSDTEYCVFLRESGAFFNSSLSYEDYRKVMLERTNKVYKKYGHPTVKHLWMVEKTLKISSKEGDIVLDPFIGSGTTAIAAENLNRFWIGIEINKEYAEITKRRLLTEINKYTLFDFFENKTKDL